MKIVALAGGVGGARLADGLARCLQTDELTVVVNTGDDFEHYGLQICPDIDTVCYTLSGLANSQTGWGLAGESFQALEAAERLGGPDWFRVGDRDLGTHLERTRRVRAGEPLSQITADFCAAWGISARVLPMSDQPVATIVHTVDEGDLAFQEYFVHQRCLPVVTGFQFQGIEQAQPAPGLLEAIAAADSVIICPSNPWVSIGPILALQGVLEALHQSRVVAVSPIIGGKAVKGPAAKMYTELGFTPSALAVAAQYRSFLSGFVLDLIDRDAVNEMAQWGIISLTTDILMPEPADRKRLARDVLDFCETLPGRNDRRNTA
ncbi:MAG TPA: 2-phospho-L-lactate transferase [Anaerolineaceae bacterium]|nr:2-phospho-L-lactate transferase [Anaerolineaceae bacterium]